MYVYYSFVHGYIHVLSSLRLFLFLVHIDFFMEFFYIILSLPLLDISKTGITSST